jgi:hypothetical protein
MPQKISTLEKFEKYFARDIDLRTNLLSPKGLDRLEALFNSEFKFIIMTNKGPLMSNCAEPKAFQVQINYFEGKYSSKNCKIADEALAGLDGVRLWLQNIKAHLGVESHTTCLIYIVGSHLDKVPCDAISVGFRKDRVDTMMAELGIEIPFYYHEISMYPFDGNDAIMPGVQDLHQSIITQAKQLSHMGERVPKPYIVIADTIRELALQKKANAQSKIL